MSNRPDDAGAELVARFDVEEEDRYEPGRVLGRGGMGEVRAAQDLRLEREVALKVLYSADPAAEARLAREASLAARLEHPGIVPVYTAGRLPDGRAYYTMRVIRGRSLAQLLRDAPDLPARLRLMRHVLDAAEAVAYAHDHGVLHRDLKPANVMVGEHGQTAVVDWGLAIELDRAPRPALAPAPAARTWGGDAPAPERTWHEEAPGAETESGSSAPNPTGELTRPGQIVGTPAYMPPEQARGEPLDRRADVYALGGVLYALLAGAPPRDSANPFQPVPPLATRCPQAPPELVAIATRAMDPDRDRRYPDAGALAADLEAWFDGRRVAAHEYSVWQHLRRVYALWRLPLNLGAVALVALAVAVGFGWWRTTVERNRAIEAERVATEASAASDRALATALVAQARVAISQGDRAAAEILAANRLRYGEDPEARGILAQLSGQPRPRLLARRAMPDCRKKVLSADGERVGCIQTERVQVLAADSGATLADRPMDAQDLVFSIDARWLFVATFDEGVQAIELETGRTQMIDPRVGDVLLEPAREPDSVILVYRKQVDHIRVGGDAPTPISECPDGTSGARQVLDLGQGRFFLRCTNSSSEIYNFFQVDWSGSGVHLFALDRTDGVPTAFAADDDGNFAVGTDRGRVVLFDLPTRRLRKVVTDLPTITSLSADAGKIAATGARGGVVIIDVEQARVYTRLPAVGGARPAWVVKGQVLRVVGAEIQDWDVPHLENPDRYDGEPGVAAVAISNDGRWLASAHGQGEIHVFERTSGALQMEAHLPGTSAKDIAFSPDGHTVAVAAGIAERSVLIPVAPEAAPRPANAPALRRLVWTSDRLFIAPYRGGLFSLPGGDPDAPRQAWAMPVEIGDMDALSDGDGLVLINQEGRLYHLNLESADPHLASLGDASDVRAIAGSRRAVWVAHTRSVSRIDLASGERTEAEIREAGTGITEIASAPGDRWLAVGLFDGTTVVLDGERLVARAVLRGHEARVGAAAFDSTGRWLVTGGWDGDVRVWDLSTLTQSAEELVAPIQEAWGLDLEAVLRLSAVRSE